MRAASKSKNGFRFPDWMVLVGALGVLVSVAVPSYLHLVRPQGVQAVLDSAAGFGEGLHGSTDARVGDLHASPAKTAGAKPARPGVPAASSAISPEAMQRFLRLYDMTGERPRSSDSAVVVEPAGLPIDRCARDGRIHLIPEAAAGGEVSAVTLLVTDRVKGEPVGTEGLLAVYKIRTEEP